MTIIKLLFPMFKNPQNHSPWLQSTTPSNSPPPTISHGNFRWKPFSLAMTSTNSLMALILLLCPQSPQITKSNWILNTELSFVKINFFLKPWLVFFHLLSSPSSLNPKHLIRHGKPWPTLMLDPPEVISNKSKTISNRYPREHSPSLSICKPLKLKPINLLHLSNHLTMKTSLRKSWKA